MKTIIYYFTGTGNSLAVAKKIAAVLGDCELVPIALLQSTTGEITPAADRVGIVNPMPPRSAAGVISPVVLCSKAMGTSSQSPRTAAIFFATASELPVPVK